MTNDSILLDDVLHAVGAFMPEALNRLPDSAKQAVADAQERGGELELRIRAGADGMHLRLLVVGEAGVGPEISRIDVPHDPRAAH